MSETFAQQFAELPLEMRKLYLETQLATKAHDRLKLMMAMDQKFRGRHITAVDVIIDWTTKAMERREDLKIMDKVILPFLRGSLILADKEILVDMGVRLDECHPDLRGPITDIIMESMVARSESGMTLLGLEIIGRRTLARSPATTPSAAGQNIPPM